jgi:hypothetical protein
MNNREKLIFRLTNQPIRPELKNELDHFMNVDREDDLEPDEKAYDIVDAFEDAMRFAEDNRDHKLLLICRYILIQAGYYRPMTQKEIDNTVVSRGSVWDFKLKGIPYIGDDSFGSWLEK